MATARSASVTLGVARAAFVCTFGLAIVAFAYGVGPTWSDASTIGARPENFFAAGRYHLSPAEAGALERIGLSRGWHAGLALGRYTLLFVSASVIAALLWRRSRSWPALYVAWFLVGSQVALSWEVALENAPDLVRFGGASMATIGAFSVVALLFVFPDDRWAPRVFAVGAAVLASLAVVRLASIDGADEVIWPVGIVMVPAALLVGIVVQVVQAIRTRDRSRGLLLVLTAGGMVLFVGMVDAAEALSGFGDLGTGLGSLARRLAVETTIMVLPMLFGAGVVYLVMQRGLWDLDLSLNRAFVYTALTALLVAVHFLVVVLVQAVVNDAADIKGSTVAVVISTGLIAAVALPAREWVQRSIDRVFFRRRYDLERTVESFEARLRDRDRLELVGPELLGAVSDAFEPAQLALWVPEVRR